MIALSVRGKQIPVVVNVRLVPPAPGGAARFDRALLKLMALGAAAEAAEAKAVKS